VRVRAQAADSLQALAFLQKEAKVLAKLSHPNIVQVYSWRQTGADYYLIEQYVPGGSLADRQEKEGPLPWQVAARYTADVGEGLDTVPAHGIIHRDVKPDNILWDPERDEAVLTDFGIAARLTDPADLGGTLVYMAPEVFQGQLSPRVDVYSLAATLFRLMTGQVPYLVPQLRDGRPDVAALVRRIGQGLPDPDPRCASLPAPLEQVIRSGLSPLPEQRPDLRTFLARLRGTLNQLLADTLPGPTVPGKAPVDLRLIVSRRSESGVYEPVATTRPGLDPTTRDMKKVPRPPQQAHLRTGDWVRIEVRADRDGFLTVFDVGPTGNLNVLYPDELPTAAGSYARVNAHQPLHILDVEMIPPAGREGCSQCGVRSPCRCALRTF
jgi:serine/threonine-protein kinase